MRLVELRPTSQGEGLRLHPRITHLRGLDPAARVAVVGLAHDLALGQPPDWDGVAEINGRTGSLIDAVTAMGETAESALIVPAESLPDLATADDVTTPDDPREVATADGVEGHESAAARVEQLQAHINELAEELQAGGPLRNDMKARLESAVTRIDDSSFRELDRVDGELARAARAAGRPDPWTGAKDRDERVAFIAAWMAELDAQLTRFPSGDRPALARDLATARAALCVGEVGHPDALALAEVLTSLQLRLDAVESRMEAEGQGTATVAARLEAAKATATVAEERAKPRPITAEEEEHLERLHDQMLQAEQRASKGVRRGAAVTAYEDAAAALHDALEPLGYPSWTALRMGNGKAAVAPELTEEAERAAKELEHAEAEWAELMARQGRNEELTEILSALDDARSQGEQLLQGDYPSSGDPGAIAKALRNLTVDAASIGADPATALPRLRVTLDTAGAIGHADLRSDAAVVHLAESWLSVLDAADHLAERVRRDRHRFAQELAAFEEMGTGSRVDRLDVPRAKVRAAETSVAEVRDALADRLNATLELHVLAATELAIAQEHDDLLAELESARVLLELAEDRNRRAAARGPVGRLAGRVPRGAGGAIPMVVVLGNAPASKLDVLLAMPDDVQMVLVGEGVGIDAWIEAAGSDVACTVDAAALV